MSHYLHYDVHVHVISLSKYIYIYIEFCLSELWRDYVYSLYLLVDCYE